jgi:hypothetical protein
MPLFGKKKPKAAPSDEHAVITHLPLSDDEHGTADEREEIFAVEDRLIESGGGTRRRT